MGVGHDEIEIVVSETITLNNQTFIRFETRSNKSESGSRVQNNV